MAVITRAYSEVNGQIAQASSVNKVIDDLYTLQNGNINSANIGSSGVGTSNIEASAVTTTKINTSAVTTAKLDNSAVTGPKIGDSAVGTSAIADNGVIMRHLDYAAYLALTEVF